MRPVPESEGLGLSHCLNRDVHEGPPADMLNPMNTHCKPAFLHNLHKELPTVHSIVTLNKELPGEAGSGIKKGKQGGLTQLFTKQGFKMVHKKHIKSEECKHITPFVYSSIMFLLCFVLPKISKLNSLFDSYLSYTPGRSLEDDQIRN